MKLSITAKILVIIVLTCLLAVAAGIIYSTRTTSDLVEKSVVARKEFLRKAVDSQISSKMDIGLTNAIGFAANRDLQKALVDQDRELARNVISEVSEMYKKNSNFKGIQIHLHTAEQISFIRSWDFAKHGDSLQSLRPSLKEVVSKQKGWVGFEVGTVGFALRAVVPVMEKNKLLGTLEFLQGVGSVSRDFQDAGASYILLVKPEAASISTKLQGNEKIGSFYVANKAWFSDEVMQFARNVDLPALLKQGHLITDKHFITSIPVKNYLQQEIGYHILGEDVAILQSEIDLMQKTSRSFLMLIIALMVVICIALLLGVRQLVSRPLRQFQSGLLNFFAFLNKEQEDIQPIALKSKDEIGFMASVINENMHTTKALYLQDKDIGEQVRRTIAEVESAVKKAQCGFFNFQVQSSCDQPEVRLLVENFNNLVASSRTQFENISRAILSFSESNFTMRLKVGHASGSMGGVISSINTLGVSVSELMSFITNVGSKMSVSAGKLSEVSHELREASRQQSQAIEESTASIQELTEYIHGNYQKVESLLEKTNLMKNIISTIGAIAEQTDLLALNATIEAARAGEHGKGFAVVSGEVKSLALQTKNALTEINETIKAVVDTVRDVAQGSDQQQKMVAMLSESSSELASINVRNSAVGGKVNEYAEDVQFQIDSLVATAGKATTLQRPMDQICDMEFVFEIAALKLAMINFIYTFTESMATCTAIPERMKEFPLTAWVQRSQQRSFTDTDAWKKTVVLARELEAMLKSTCEACHHSGEKFAMVVENVMRIEALVDKLFDSIDRIKTEECLKRA